MGFIKERGGEEGVWERGQEGGSCFPAIRNLQHQAAAHACRACVSVSPLLPWGSTHSLIKIHKLLY